MKEKCALVDATSYKIVKMTDLYGFVPLTIMSVLCIYLMPWVTHVGVFSLDFVDIYFNAWKSSVRNFDLFSSDLFCYSIFLLFVGDHWILFLNFDV